MKNTDFFSTFAVYIHKYYKYNILGSIPISRISCILESMASDGKDKVNARVYQARKNQPVNTME